MALAPDLYHGQVVSSPNEARKLVMALDMDAAVGEIQAAIDFLLQQQAVAGPKVGLTGFCMGGRLVLMTALADDRLGAAVPWYGSPLTAEQAGQVKAPILGLYGEQDGGIPAASVRDMQRGWTGGIANDFVIYPGAQHAFFNDTRPSYHPQAADDAWQRAVAWFRKYLVE